MSQVWHKHLAIDGNCKNIFEETDVGVSQLINNCSDQFIKCIFPENA
jgi:hypothetical protein